MEKDNFKPKKKKLKRGEFLLYYVDGLNSMNNKLNADYIISQHIKYSKLTDEEREFYHNYENNLNGLNIQDNEITEHSQLPTIEEISEKMKISAQKGENEYRYNEIQRKLDLKTIGNQHQTKLHHKFNYLIHLFCSRCTNNENGYTKINSEFLKDIIGNEYNIALYTLLRIGFIDTDGAYTIGKSSKAYSIKDKYISSIRTKPEYNVTVKKYIDKGCAQFEAYKRAKFKRLSDRDKFIVERYDNCLSRLKITFSDECENFIYNNKEYEENKPIQREYYQNVYNKYIYKENGPFTINKIDNDNRIYHILTNTPKDLKQFLNIKFSIDIKNSHPLLLNKLLSIYYSDNKLFNNIINKDINIYNILISNNNLYTHYAYENPHNKLIYNSIDKLFDNAPNIPADVRKYIIKTSQGQMWEELLEACEEKGLEANSRGELKAQMFAEVFYSKTKTMSYKDYGKVFKAIYPNVFKVINELKPNGDETKLSHIIMKVESELFYQILEKIYKETEYDAINIHDAIVLLDTPNNESCSDNEIETIMREVYNIYSLFPSFSVELYGNQRKF
ncbi:hypothetical protein E2605_08520 [Dysgonomonas capnocytophagoides]|uniref:Uncharacterized protein n=1 Tax=Dysgonomonas capnocytophagoides TaxID=45254 RepID=A0A4Y8L3I8_9BACT|nr:hypothetical protein [Dysgonomonas capnocytophagoides]TFD96847.1 hypothetical protein E2605_08520 [Dysgonomonas capnocytophagoides]